MLSSISKCRYLFTYLSLLINAIYSWSRPLKQQLGWEKKIQVLAEVGLHFLAADHSWQKTVWCRTDSCKENVLRNPREFIPAGPVGNQTAVYLTSFPNPPSPSSSRSPPATEPPWWRNTYYWAETSIKWDTMPTLRESKRIKSGSPVSQKWVVAGQFINKWSERIRNWL